MVLQEPTLAHVFTDWTPIDLHQKLLRLVAGTSARIFVGYPMCRDEEVRKLDI